VQPPLGLARLLHTLFGLSTMHPSVRIVTLVVLAALLGRGGGAELILAGVLLAGLYTGLRVHDLRPLLTLLRRLRWLLLSLMVIYLWFTPGPALIPLLGALSPSQSGLALGLLRVGLLVVLVAAVSLLLERTPREQLLTGIYWLATPLQWLGLSRERLALRMVLVLETVPQVQPLVQPAQAAAGEHGTRALRRVGRVAADLFAAAVERAEHAPCRTVEVRADSAPPLVQWLYPIGLAALFWAVA
jgi:energy-coupling factor transporter transmembrane protein EcfT